MQSIPVPTTQTTIALAVAGLTGYLIACRRMRYVRSQAYSARFAGQTREELYQNITLTEAEEVIHAIARYEFPRIYNTSLQFALFRVCPLLLPCACVCVCVVAAADALWLAGAGWLVTVADLRDSVHFGTAQED